MKRMLIVSPHFSTGGAPQVTLNKVKLLKDDFELKVVEYSFLSWKFVVQRNQVIELVGKDNFITFSGEDSEKKEQLERLLSDFQPDIVSMEEFPEMFMGKVVADELYSPFRTYAITETTHDSSFNIQNKRYYPNKFLFVSAFNAIKFAHYDNLWKYKVHPSAPIGVDIIEYPVDTSERNKQYYRDTLKLEYAYKNVVIIGLFTPRKNQEYAFKIAEKLKKYNIKFHFLGNQADNFSYYWKPLLQNKPENCVIWGERSDIDAFIQASDLFLFSSKGDRGNKELNPIVIKEASMYKDLPKLMYNLDVYLEKYTKDESFHFLTGELDTDAQKVIELTGAINQKSIQSEELIIIGTYPNLKKREDLTVECIQSLRPLNRKIMLVSHYPVSIEIQKLVDYYVYDAENPLTHHSYYTRFFNYKADYDVEININGLKNSNQSLTVLTNLYNAYKAAKSYGYVKAFYITYDVIVKKEDYPNIENSFAAIDEQCKAYLSTLNTPFGHGIQTTAMTFHVEHFLGNFHDFREPNDYNKICSHLGAQNFLEDYMYKVVRTWDESTYKLITNPKETFLVHSGLGVSSNSEYYSILPVHGKENIFMFYFYTYNVDERKMNVRIDNHNGTITNVIDISKNREYKFEFEYKNHDVFITMDFYDGDRIYKTEKYEITESNIDTYRRTGFFKWKKKPKIKVLHLQTTLNLEKEIASKTQLEQLVSENWQYVIHQNVPYTDLPPKDNCIRPQCVSTELFDEETVQKLGTALTPAHYGCFESFKNGILSEFDKDIDFLIVCEGDCKIIPSLNEFIEKVEKVCEIISDKPIGYVSFGDTHTLEHKWLQSPVVEEIANQDLIFITNHIIGLQCIMFPQKVRKWLIERLRTHKWDGADMYFNSIFRYSEHKMAIVKERLTSQFDGYSLIDKQEKNFI